MRQAIDKGQVFALRTLRPYMQKIEEERFARLRLDRDSLGTVAVRVYREEDYIAGER